jgi:hypothetical protein
VHRQQVQLALHNHLVPAAQGLVQLWLAPLARLLLQA